MKKLTFCYILVLIGGCKHTAEVIGKWKITNISHQLALCMPDLPDSVTYYDPFGEFDTTLTLRKDFTFENSRGYSGKWFTKKFSKADTFSRGQFYLILDTIKYDSFITDSTLRLTRQLGESDPSSLYYWARIYDFKKLSLTNKK